MTPIAPAYVSDGTIVDLADFRPEHVDIYEMANVLSKIARFNGIPMGKPYSVAQHCVLGAESLMATRNDDAIAAGFLLHDAHEYLIGDIVTPAVDLIAHHLRAGLNARIAAADILLQLAIHNAKAALDTAIFEAAGLPAPPLWPSTKWATVKQMDARMAQAEAAALFGVAPDRRIGTPRLAEPITPWPAAQAEERFLTLYGRLIGPPHRRVR